MVLSALKNVVVQLLVALKIGGRILKVVGKGVLTRLWAVTSRSRLAAFSIMYYVVYKNLDAFMSLDPQRIVVTIGSTLLEADKVILEETVQIVQGSVPPVPVSLPVVEATVQLPGTPFAVVTIVSAFVTIMVWIKAAALMIRSSNPTIGHGGVYGFPIVVYALSVFAVSALNGDPRFPFQGVIVLVQNLDAVLAGADPGPLIEEASKAVVNSSG